jgi:hypothetical protein
MNMREGLGGRGEWQGTKRCMKVVKLTEILEIRQNVKKDKMIELVE